MNRPLLREIASGATVMAGGLGFSLASLKYQLGTFVDMAPGMFPFLIGLLIALTGAMILVAGLTDPTLRRPVANSGASASQKADQLRAFLVVVTGILVFGLTIRVFGMVPAVVALVLVVGLAEHERRPLQSLAISGALATLATLIFIFGLGMNIQIATWGL